ncbi:MAG: APC family permease, partial [Deltaproteobacteria bacterium]|nr:APC family permease [Deltaproteobacteria bacterium]
MTESPKSTNALRTDAVTLLGAVTLGVVMLSPAMTIYGNFAASFAAAGRAAPLAFVIALLATLPTATSYALLSRDFPAAGSAAAWTSRSLGPRAARFLGWMTVLYYLTNFVLQPVTFGLFFRDLLATIGLQPSFWLYALGAVLCCAIPAGMVYRGISPSTKGAFGFLILESVVVLALCVFAAVTHPGGALDFSGFSPAVLTSSDGLSGISRALVFAMLSFCGFDVISTLAEEARLARQMIPRATFYALLSFGGLIILGIWTLTFAAPPARLQQLADAPGMPITALASDLWGRASLLVTATGLSAALGIVIATSVGASRVLFSMAREGLAPGAFARLDATSQVPRNGLHLVFSTGLLGAIVVAALTSPWEAYLWWGTTSTFFAMITFLFVNVAALV